MLNIEYIVKTLIKHGVKDVFGYPGGMVTYLMDTLDKYQNKISVHINYHEQASAFSACAHAQVSNNLGVAFATSGPGATNLITGICNAYFDSLPVLFITGQVNTYESKGALPMRQKGFQETDVVALAQSVCKYSKKVENPEELPEVLEKAIRIAMEGRKGPVLLDIPMNIQRAEFTLPKSGKCVDSATASDPREKEHVGIIIDALSKANRTCLLVGAGVRQSGNEGILREVVDLLGVPVVSSMIAVDVLPSSHPLNFGFIGAYGNRFSNIIVAKCDLLITLGSRLDIRQTGANPAGFAANAKILRVDIDEGELQNRISENEIQLHADLSELLPVLKELLNQQNPVSADTRQKWFDVCGQIRKKLEGIDDLLPNHMVRAFSNHIPENAIITTDVGQNQVWVAQSFLVKDAQKILFSGGHGAMGYSLPAAIGAYYAQKEKGRVYSINGDGGIQINIQELQFLARERLPITVVILNNQSLGMIRHFQEMYFNSNFSQTVEEKGYSVPDFERIAHAYGLAYVKVYDVSEINSCFVGQSGPQLVEIALGPTTYVYPKLAYDKPIHRQEPPLPDDLTDYLMAL